MCLIIDEKRTALFKQKTGKIYCWKIVKPIVYTDINKDTGKVTFTRRIRAQVQQYFYKNLRKTNCLTAKGLLYESRWVYGGAIHASLVKRPSHTHSLVVRCYGYAKDLVGVGPTSEMDIAFKKLYIDEKDYAMIKEFLAYKDENLD